MINPILLTASLMALVIAQPAIAQDKDEDDTLVLEPSSDWQLREMDDRCRLSRRFGNGEDRTTLWIDKGGPGTSANLTMIGHPFRHPYGTNMRVSLGENEPVNRNYITSTSSRGRPVVALFGVKLLQRPNSTKRSPSTEKDEGSDETVELANGEVSAPNIIHDAEEQLEKNDRLKLEGAVIKPVSLELGSLVDPIEDLRICTEKLTERLAENSGPPRNGRTHVYPKDQEQWAQKIQANYPFHLLAAGQEAIVGIRVTISAQGRVTFCEVIEHSGPASFNDTACLLLLRHARFHPATNPEGEPVPAFFHTTIVYRIRK